MYDLKVYIIAILAVILLKQAFYEPVEPDQVLASIVAKEKLAASLSLDESSIRFSKAVTVERSGGVAVNGNGKTHSAENYEGDTPADVHTDITYASMVNLRCSPWNINCYWVSGMQTTAERSIAPRL